MQTGAEVSNEAMAGRGLRSGLTGHIPRGQVLRYVLVGGCNTAFSYGLYALLTHLFTRWTNFYPYEFASVLGSLISITVSFLGYKWFVFRTRGHYLREWMRATAVYTTSIVITTIALPLLVGLLRQWTRYPQAAPYIAGGIVTAASVTMSFFGHKHFSFRRRT
jgi:putative flippase GtrA